MSKIARSLALVALVLSLSVSSQAASSDRGGPQQPSLIAKIIKLIRHIAVPNDETIVIPKP